MIVFQKLKYKNFLSTGNQFTEIDFTESKTTLVVGSNGSGKSTMLDALSFALFGKPHRKINIPQLVNSINQKNCVVEVEFSVGGSNFKVVRKLKPAKLELWKNGTMLNQNSKRSDYQKILEQNILKLNHKSFHQIVVLGSSSFIPFMQLASHHRREVIDDLIDLNVFSGMLSLIKEKIAKGKDEIKENDYNIDIGTTKLDAQKKYIRDISKINKDYKKEKQDKIDELKEEIITLSTEVSEQMESVVPRLKLLSESKDKQEKKREKLKSCRSQISSKMKSIEEEVEFLNNNESCPTCEQEITEEFRSQKMEIYENKRKEFNEGLSSLENELSTMQDSIDETKKELEEIYETETNIRDKQKRIEHLQEIREKTQKELEESHSSDNLKKAQKELRMVESELNALREKKFELNEQMQYNVVISEMLKDTGIKTKIIKQYIPVINRYVNNYLQILDFFVHFELDETFSETIRSRYRDDFSYDSFSEGEKQRIDLSLLFTWRQVAKMKNSVATNLLILDETFDSSLDQDGVENLMKILYTLGEETNVFVISHKGDILEGKFQSKISFVKQNNFSKMQK